MTDNSGSAEALHKFFANDWVRWLDLYPEIATSIGRRGFDDRWTDDSPEGIARRKHQLTASLHDLEEVRAEGLSRPDRTSYDLYHDLLETAQRGVVFGLDPLPFRFGVPHSLLVPINQMEGIHLTISDILYIQPHETTDDYENHLRRLAAAPAAIDQNIALMETGRLQGQTPHRVAVRGVPDQVRGLIPEAPSASPLLQAFGAFPDLIPVAEQHRLTEEADRLYRSAVAPSFARLHDYLVGQYLPACRESPGVSSLPDGRALYDFLVAWQTTTPLTAREVHEIGLAEVRRLRSAMERVMTETGFSGTLPQFFEYLRSDDRFFYTDAAALVDGYRVLAKKIDPGLARVFGHLPRLPYGVLPVPEFRAPSSPTAYYMPGAPATGRPGIFYANTYSLHSRARWEMEALTLHEAVPGHHLQISVAQELEDLPDFRRFSGPTAYVEGWGLYAESLGGELGLYEDPYARMGQYVYDMWRSIRLVVDTGIHSLGWSRDDALRFFRENTGKSEVDIGVEVDRYIVWPGQALAYKIGQLKIRELRTWAEKELGERFDRRAFHDRVLEDGAVPLGMLDEHVREWATGQDPKSTSQ